MSQKLESTIAVIGIDIGKNSFHIVGHDERGAIRAAAEVVTWPGRGPLCQYTAVPDRKSGLKGSGKGSQQWVKLGCLHGTSVVPSGADVARTSRQVRFVPRHPTSCRTRSNCV